MLENILEEMLSKKGPDKIKVSSAEIVVHGTREKPYYEKKYYDLSDNEYHIGFSSYSLDVVCGYLDGCFEIVDKHMNDGWIPVEEQLPEESGYYRVTVKNTELGDITEETAWFAHVDDYDIDESEWRELYEYEKVIAWRELSPYHQEKGAEK